MNSHALRPVHPNYHEYDLTPPVIPAGFCRDQVVLPYVSGEPVQITEHSPLFDPKNKRHDALADFLWSKVLSPYFARVAQ